VGCNSPKTGQTRAEQGGEVTLGSEEYTLTWFSSPRAAAVVLVVHGLNVKPQMMGSLIEALTRRGLEVLNVALHGHGGNYPPQVGISAATARLAALRQVSAGLWRTELHAAYRVAALRAAQLGGVPICFVGYSLGGLMGCDLFADASDVHFARMVLLAPALQIHPASYILRLLAHSPHTVIPSATPAVYRANQGTPIAAYQALYAAIAHFEAHAGININVPTLLLMDKQDELVSYTKIRRLLATAALTQWQIKPVTKGPGATMRYHHLLIDAASVGPARWQTMAAAITGHLRPMP
jgi:alpha-beta hydrolase superfamily lysophospholipase